MNVEISSITYRVALTNAQQAKLDRKWPDGDPFISYEKMEKLLEPLPVSDLDWSNHAGQFFYFTIHGEDIEGTLAEVLERLKNKLGSN